MTEQKVPRAITYAERPAMRRWTRREYARLIDLGILDEDEPIELLDGLLLVKEPQSSAHMTAVTLVAQALERAFGEGWFVQVQGPIGLDDRSEPEPDVCVVRGAPRDYIDAHPTRPALVVEVTLSGLRAARGRKAIAYARGGIADYWIVNLADRVLEVYREPARPGPARRRWGYASIETLGADGAVIPLAAPSARVRVADLLP
jgi:Uma2 family endonuclease